MDGSDLEIVRDRPGHRRLYLPSGMVVETYGEYGNDEDGSVHLLDADGVEIVTWSMDEWRDEPSLMATIFDAMTIEPAELVAMLRKTRIEGAGSDRCWV